MHLLKVGEKAPAPFCNSGVSDGAMMDMDRDGNIVILIYYDGITKSEAEEIGSGKIEAAYVSDPPFWMGMIKVGKTLCEIEFDPALHLRGRGSFDPECFRKNTLVTILGIDSKTKIIKALKVATFPVKLLDSIYLSYSGNANWTQGYSQKYQLFLNHKRAVSMEALWDKMDKAGYFGDE